MSYNVNSFVNNNEANALKEMIFNRVRERAQSMNEDIQSDVMEIARESFVSQNNPFSQIIQNTQNINETINTQNNTQQTNTQPEKENIGFKQKPLKARAIEQERIVHNQVTALTINNTMNEAREALTNKKSFMGALNFLNAQAAVSLMRTRADKFEVVI